MTAFSSNHPVIRETAQYLADYGYTFVRKCGQCTLVHPELSHSELKIEIVRSDENKAALRLWAGPKGQLASSRLDEIAESGLIIGLREDTQWPETFGSDDALYLSELAMRIIEWVEENRAEVKVSGVTFEDTDFAGYGERDFMAALVQIQKSGYATLIPDVGSNLGFEYQVPSTGSRIDAVEFDSEGSVVTVIECQSGVQSGNHLDAEHFEKAISRYPQSEEISQTVRKIVIIAGGYSAAQLATFAQLPYEIVALVTTVVDGRVVLAPVG